MVEAKVIKPMNPLARVYFRLGTHLTFLPTPYSRPLPTFHTLNPFSFSLFPHSYSLVSFPHLSPSSLLFIPFLYFLSFFQFHSLTSHYFLIFQCWVYYIFFFTKLYSIVSFEFPSFLLFCMRVYHLFYCFFICTCSPFLHIIFYPPPLSFLYFHSALRYPFHCHLSFHPLFTLLCLLLSPLSRLFPSSDIFLPSPISSSPFTSPLLAQFSPSSLFSR